MIVTVGDLVGIGAEMRWVKAGLAGMQFSTPIEIEKALGKAVRAPKVPATPTSFRPLL